MKNESYKHYLIPDYNKFVLAVLTVMNTGEPYDDYYCSANSSICTNRVHVLLMDRYKQLKLGRADKGSFVECWL